MSKRFLILAHARSGSTTLLKMVVAHPRLSAITEPFNKNRRLWGKEYITDNRDLQQVKAALAEVYSEVDGFKHLVEQSSYAGNIEIINKANTVITIRRNNHLQATLSNFICQQANHWRTNKRVVLSHKYKPISIEKFKKALAFQRDKLQSYDKFIGDNAIKHYKVIYEDLYSSKKTMDEKLAIVQEIYNFIDVESLLGKKSFEQLKKLLDPVNSKLNSFESYKLIPNIDEIAELGSEENGFLFTEI